MLNIRRLKSLRWLASTLALVGAGWTFYDIFKGKRQENRYTPKQATYYHAVLTRDVDPDKVFVAGPTWYDEADYTQLWLARIDGSQMPAPEEQGPSGGDEVEQVQQLEAIDTVLQVGMLMWHSDPLLRLIAVEYVGADSAAVAPATKTRRLHLVEGEPLRPPYDAEPYFGKVLRIDEQTVTFAWGEGEETLTPGLGSDGEGVPESDFKIADAEDVWEDHPTRPEDSLQRDDGSWIVGTKDLVELEDGGAQEILNQDIGARTITPSEGGRSFVELTDVKSGSLPARYGFQSGDRIISVNGIPMKSVADAISWGKNNPDLPSYDVLYERRGVQQHVVLHLGSGNTTTGAD